MPQRHLPSALARAPRSPTPSRSDAPSLLYLGGFALNTLMLACLPAHPLLALQCLLQGFFFVGLLEMTHQCVHHAFIASSRKANEVVGLCAAALIGFNLVTYHHFHFEHHRHTSDADDPEGHLYADSPNTRWLILAAPIAHVYVALGIHRLTGRYVPDRERGAWLRSQRLTLVLLLALVSWAVLSPWSFLRTYLFPLCLFAWLDFLFSQAEHYEAPVRDSGVRCNVADVSYDIRVPAWLSALMLHRNLHRVHHVWPSTRWFEAPRRMRELAALQPGRILTFAEFARRWWRLGPRTWNAEPRSAISEV
jgi:fatty acid desaturase